MKPNFYEQTTMIGSFVTESQQLTLLTLPFLAAGVPCASQPQALLILAVLGQGLPPRFTKTRVRRRNDLCKRKWSDAHKWLLALSAGANSPKLRRPYSQRNRISAEFLLVFKSQTQE